MKTETKYGRRLKVKLFNLYGFFPFRLIVDYLRYNRLLLLSWLLPFLYVTNSFGQKFGVPTLFTVPEYLGTVNAVSFLFTGLATGSFIMAFHIASYVVIAHRYPFIIRFKKPFYIYALNNSVIPVLFLVTYLYHSAIMQKKFEMIPTGHILLNLLVFLSGVVIFVYLSFAFFWFVVRIAPRWLKKIRKKIDGSIPKKENLISHLTTYDAQKKIAESPLDDKIKSKVKFYLINAWKVNRTGYFSHYSTKQFTKVFQYQHINALLYMVFILVLILVRGLIKNSPAYILPAGASFFVLFTVVLLIISLFYLSFRSWTVLIVLMLFISYSYFLPFKNVLDYHNSAYGLNYKNSNKTILNLQAHGNFRSDSLNTIQILNRWKAKNVNQSQPSKKPTLIIVCTSGGGLKMAVWTNLVLTNIDSLTNGRFFKHVQLITGASGGMIGAAYFRENYLTYKNTGKKYWTQDLTKLLAKDILNPIFYTFSMSDWFFRLQRFQYNRHRYFVDRGYAFEQTLMNNIGQAFNKPLKSYRPAEAKAIIPMMFVTPSIENSGSRMLISATPASYMIKSSVHSQVKNIEFCYTYKQFNACDLRFATALRMNATFPYVSPDVALPGKPTLFLIDAGLNDNFGIYSAYDFIIEFKKWILQNTSGLILLRLDEHQKMNYNYLDNPLQSALRPIGSVFVDWANIQKVTQQSLIQTLHSVMGLKFTTISLEFNESTHKIALSWHLSKLEKQLLYRSLYDARNQQKIKKISRMIEP